MTKKNRVKSIAAATGWWKAYNEDDLPTFDPVLCFAVVQDPEDPEMDMIVGQTNSIIQNGVERKEASNFQGYYHESDFEVIGVSLTKAAMDRFYSGGA